MNFSVVRGADTYFGRAVAQELSGLGKNLLLVGNDRDILEDLEGWIRENSVVKVFHFISDDAFTESIIKLCDHINTHFTVDILFSYIETDISQKFADQNIMHLDRKLKLNYVSAPVYTHQLLPNLLLNADAYIINAVGILESPSQHTEILKQLNVNFSTYLQFDLRDFDIKVAAWDVNLVNASEGFHEYKYYSKKAKEFLQNLFCQKLPVNSF